MRAENNRIISLGPAITEELYLLGAEDKLIGCTVYCVRPKEAEKKEKVGTVIDVDVEKIAYLKPDLVITTPLTNKKDLEALKRLKINIINFPTAVNFPQICTHFLELGKITGKEEEAGIIVRKAEDKVKDINSKVENLPKTKVFIQTGANPLYTSNKNSFVHDYVIRAGGINIAAESGGGLNCGIYSREQVLRQNPDVIIIVTMGIVGEQEKEAWENFSTLSAVKNKRIHIIDSNKACSPTPLSFAEMLGEIAVLLHPEIKKEG